MGDNLNQVFEKAKGDSEFAKELLFGDMISACQKAGISLNRTEIKILGDAMKEIRTYFMEKLFVIAKGPDVLWQIGCAGCLAANE